MEEKALPDKNKRLKKSLQEAMARHQKGQLETADNLYDKVLRWDLNNPDALHLKGVLAFQQERYHASVDLISRAIKEDSSQAAFYNNLGNTFNALGKYERSIACFKKAVEIDPAMADAFFNLANAYQKKGEFDKAIDHYHRAIQLKPDCAHIYNNLGITFDDKGQVDNAVNAYRMAIKLDPDCVDAYNNLCALQEGMSQLTDALDTAKTALKIDPSSSFAMLNLAKVYYRQQRFEDAIALLRTLTKKQLSDTFNARVYYLHGKVCNKMERYDRAFSSFTTANQCVFKSHAMSAYRRKNALTLKEIDEIQAFFSSARIRCWKRFDPATAKHNMVFLVGFPRSGTTLLEQILNTHKRVVTLDEQPIFENVFNGFRNPSERMKQLDQLSKAEIEYLRKSYLDKVTRKINNDESIETIVDKLPLNILYLGIMYRFFPDAKIIVALRHPLGCVLSAFMQEFKINKMMFNFLTLEGCARFYAKVMGLYLHYQSVLPMQIYQIRYEDIVDDFENEIRSLFDFLALEWQGLVLNYHQSAKDRKISTPSYSQVVKPIYRDAIDRWKHYRTHLSPALTWVEPFIQSFGYKNE